MKTSPDQNASGTLDDDDLVAEGFAWLESFVPSQTSLYGGFLPEVLGESLLYLDYETLGRGASEPLALDPEFAPTRAELSELFGPLVSLGTPPSCDDEE
jgi:hypothetical protein